MYPEVGLLDQMLFLFLTFLWKLHSIFPQQLHYFTFSSTAHKSSNFSTYLSSLFSHFMGMRCCYFIVVLSYISPMISDAEHYVYIFSPYLWSKPFLSQRLLNKQSTNPFKAFHNCITSISVHTTLFCKSFTSAPLNASSSSKQVPCFLFLLQIFVAQIPPPLREVLCFHSQNSTPLQYSALALMVGITFTFPILIYSLVSSHLLNRSFLMAVDRVLFNHCLPQFWVYCGPSKIVKKRLIILMDNQLVEPIKMSTISNQQCCSLFWGIERGEDGSGKRLAFIFLSSD